MKDLNTIISIFAIIISVFALIHTYTRGRWETQLKIAQLRSDLLTRIMKLESEYADTIRKYRYLLDIAERDSLPIVSDISKLINNYKGYLKLTQGYYSDFLNKEYSAKFIVDVSHHIDTMRVTVEVETRQLQEKVEKNEVM